MCRVTSLPSLLKFLALFLTILSLSNTNTSYNLVAPSCAAIAVISFCASFVFGRPDIISTSMSKVNTLWPVEGISLSYMSTNTLVVSGTSDSNKSSLSSLSHFEIRVSLSPYIERYCPYGSFLYAYFRYGIV